MVVVFPENPPYSRRLRALLEPLLPAGCLWRTLEGPEDFAALAGERLLFAVALDEGGCGGAYYRMLSALRREIGRASCRERV